MNRSLPAAILLLAATSALAAPPRPSRGLANPGGVIAAELGFAALAQEKGQWTAFRETAAKGAMMFAPQPVLVAEYLKGKADPPVAVKWQPHAVWSSCDGTFAVTRGAWQRPGSTGYFITVWQRQGDGGYKWVLDQGDALAKPLPDEDMIEGTVGDCPGPAERIGGYGGGRERRERERDKPAPLPDPLNGASPDGTLSWTTTVDAAGNRAFTVRLKKDGAPKEVINVSARAQP